MWLRVPGLEVEFAYLLDRLSLIMLLVVTGVGSCVFIYSTAYMHGDKSYPRFFASLSLFAFSMLGIVLANNFLMLFVFWELVAVSSYLLIGFWFEKPSAADAGNKAFIVNRVADFGMVLGVFSVWAMSGLGGGERTFQFAQLEKLIPEMLAQGAVTPAALTVAALLVFCGVVGKSAQFPLYIWLPDAMEGPTPVSALIHAATMVAAGVFMLSRVFFLVAGVPQALHVIACFGAATALLAAMLAVAQDDIKKILAYSTVSQLGYMVLALGLGSSAVAMYHLTTHAFFKALLFLGAGSLIHGYHTQDIWEMGGAWKEMRVTAATFLIGTLALCGIWPLSGFFSKDEILALAFEHNKALYAIGLFTAGLTAFYMSRALWIAVFGSRRVHQKGHGHGHDHAHESPLAMTAPLVLLAVLSAVAGYLGLPAFLAGEHGHHEEMNMAVAITSTIVALAGLGLGTLVYARLKGKEDPLKKALGAFYTFLVRKYYLDEIAQAIADAFQKSLAGVLFVFDSNVVMKAGVDGAARATAGVASFLRRAQTGRVQTYALAFALGVAGLVFFVTMQGGR
jgi:NADH-quinone oxidoreductase subunit L